MGARLGDDWDGFLHRSRDGFGTDLVADTDTHPFPFKFQLGQVVPAKQIDEILDLLGLAAGQP
jgi:hypothetical protein